MPLVPGVVTKGQTSVVDLLPRLGIPEDLSAKRILDIGCSDGFFSFLAEQRGAEVVAIDTLPTRGFEFTQKLLGSKIRFHKMSVYDVTPDRLGLFDIVFFFGVYYHLRHPVLALERIASVTKDCVIVESAILKKSWAERLSVAQFFEIDKPDGDATQYYMPTVEYLLRTVRSGGFPRVELFSQFFHPQRGYRAVVRGYKTPIALGKALSDSIIIRIDEPRPGSIVLSERISISGWIIDSNHPDGNGVERVEVFLDGLEGEGILLGEAKLRERLELAKHLKVTSLCGYQLTCDLPKVSPGEHILYVCARTVSGWNFHAVTIAT